MIPYVNLLVLSIFENVSECYKNVQTRQLEELKPWHLPLPTLPMWHWESFALTNIFCRDLHLRNENNSVCKTEGCPGNLSKRVLSNEGISVLSKGSEVFSYSKGVGYVSIETSYIPIWSTFVSQVVLQRRIGYT